ncbi:hypothetical protein FOA52_006660 [Chlamydomonas sp. UWO 241]|nr:hypothetical protein FOA52_006660 [Chlamydomonas sp. UWO 241]
MGGCTSKQGIFAKRLPRSHVVPTWDPLVTLVDRAVHPLFLAACAQVEVEVDGRKVKLGDLKTYEVVQFFIKPATAHTQRSLVETVAEMVVSRDEDDGLTPLVREAADARMSTSGLVTKEIDTHADKMLNDMLSRYRTWVGGSKPFHGHVTYFLSHAWSFKFGDLCNMAKQHYEMVTGTQYKYEEVYYWVDIFSVAQNFNGDFQKHPDGKFPIVIRESQGVVFTIYPWNAPIAPSRIWCLFEAVTAVEEGINLELLIEQEFSNVKQPVPALHEQFRTMVAALDVGLAQASVDSDRTMILDMVRKRAGGIAGFNTLMRDLLSSRMLGVLLLRALAAQDARQAASLAQQGAAFDYRVQKFQLTRLTDASMVPIATALGQSKHNFILDLSPRTGSGFLTGKGVKTLAEALKKESTVLRELCLSNHPQIGDDGIHALVDALRVNTTLSTMHLANTGVDDSCAAELGKMLRSTSSLTSLSLANNTALHAPGVRKLFSALEANASLRVLDLTAVRINSSQAGTCEALASCLARNNGLERLVLHSCCAGVMACESIAEGLATNKSLTFLDLSCNPGIGDDGACALAPCLASNKTLQGLALKQCDIGREGCKALADALTASALHHLDLRDNKLLKRHDWDHFITARTNVRTIVSLDHDEAHNKKVGLSSAAPWIPEHAHALTRLAMPMSRRGSVKDMKNDPSNPGSPCKSGPSAADLGLPVGLGSGGGLRSMSKGVLQSDVLDGRATADFLRSRPASAFGGPAARPQRARTLTGITARSSTAKV